MTVVAVILARLDSTRLPRKTLISVAGIPVVQHVYEACARSEADHVVLATTHRSVDRDLVRWAEGIGCRVVCGPAEDVASRFLRALDALGAEAGVRVNGDSPMQRSELLSWAIDTWRVRRCDVVTNVPERRWPPGLSLEVVARSAMAQAVREMRSDHHRQHVTSFFYANPEKFDLYHLPPGPPGSREADLAVDTSADLRRFQHVATILGKEFPRADVSSLIRAARDHDHGSDQGEERGHGSAAEQ